MIRGARNALISIDKTLSRLWRRNVIIAGLAVILVGAMAVGALSATRDAGTYHARIGSYRQDDPYRIVVSGFRVSGRMHRAS